MAAAAPLLVAALTGGAIAAQDQAPAASGVITGRVVAADSGAPIRGAQVRLRSVRGGADVRIATTDDRGVFEARNLFPGQWTIAASKSGFTTVRYGQRRSTDDGTPVGLGNGQRVQVSLALPRAGAITGRVFDEFGEPLLGARIQATRTRVVRGVRQLAAVGASDTTDDTGAFRLFGLPPGSYYVTATLRASTPDSELVQGTVGGVTYYPGTGDISQALPLVLRAGDEPSLSFQVLPVRSVRVSGVVLSATGAPAADTEVRMMRMDATEVGTTVGNFGRSGADGTFTVIDVPPGQYVVSAVRVRPITPDRASRPFDNVEETMQAVSVGADDVSGVTLAMHTGVTVNGVVDAESGSLPADLKFEVTATPVYPIGRGPAVIQVTRTAGRRLTFQFPGIFGPVVFGAMLPDGLMLRAVELDGADVTDRAAELNGPTPPELRLVITGRVTEVTGQVMRDGTPVPDTSVVVFSVDEDRWMYPSRRVAFGDTDDRGRFTIRRLPPGEQYYAAAVPLLEDGDQYDPELLRALRAHATPFSLADGERKSLTLTMDR